MQTREFAMTRRIILATLMAAFLAFGSPAWSEDKKTDDQAETQQATNETGDESGFLDSAAPDQAMGDSAQAQEFVLQPPSSVIPEMSGAPDSLSNFGPSSGTVVGNRALELRDEVLRLRSSVTLNAGEFALLRSNGAAGAVQYHSTVAAITARLQNGTTRGNPILLRQWDEAETSLNEVTSSLNRLNALQTSVAADASLASYLLESIQAAFQLSGAVDEDHDQLKLVRDEVSRLVVQLDYLRNQVADDIQRQTSYLTAERSNLQALAFAITRGELMGSSLANRPVIVNPSPVMMLPNTTPQPQYSPAYSTQQVAPSAYAPPPAAAPTAPVTTGGLGPSPMSPRDMMQETGQLNTTLNTTQPQLPSGNAAVAPTAGRLLVLIRYNQPTVEYEQQLSHAVGMALQRKPDAEFSVIAVTPVSGEPAQLATANESVGRSAEAVKRSLVQLGLSPSRISMASTQMASAQNPEVHVYVR
jgi:hypothetical protein